MGRKPNQQNVELEESAIEVNEDFDIDEIFEDYGGDDDAEITGRVYRVNSPVEAVGRPTFEAIAKVNKPVDEDWLGRNFGSGRYHIKYKVVKNGVRKLKQLNYNVGSEYDKFIKNEEQSPAASAPALSGGLNIGGLLGSLTVEKITAITAAAKMIKDLLTPAPQPQFDFVKLYEIMAANQKPSVSDAIVIESLKSMKQERPQSSIAQQIADFNALKEIFNNNSSNADEGGEMNFLIEKALEYLPLLLQKNNNNYAAVGQEASQNPLVQSLILKDQDLAQKFFQRARQEYGDENAKALARGFGLEMNIIPEVVENATQEN